MVKDYGHLRFLVASRTTHRKEYLVDLVSYNGSGRCTCPAFTCHIWPKIRDAEKFSPSDHFRCKHIREARKQLATIIGAPDDMEWLDEVIREWIKRYGKNGHGEE